MTAFRLLASACGALLAASVLGGCAAPQPYVTAERLDRGLVVVLPGIEGRGPLNEAIALGLAEGGVDYAIELYDWTGWGGPLYNLRNTAENRRQAERLAGRIVRYQNALPDRPVVLVGQSGGGAIALWAAEALPPGRQLDGVVLLAASVSRGYALDLALDKARRGIVSFYSKHDLMLLGTAVAGTMDGEFGPSAGRTGFLRPETPAGGRVDTAYARLIEIAWTEQMANAGHHGGHLTSGAKAFVAEYVAPLVINEPWDAALLAEIVGEPAQTPAPQPQPEPAPGPTTAPTTQPAARTATTQPAAP